MKLFTIRIVKNGVSNTIGVFDDIHVEEVRKSLQKYLDDQKALKTGKDSIEFFGAVTPDTEIVIESSELNETYLRILSGYRFDNQLVDIPL